MPYSKPVLLLIFNRPTTTARVFAVLKDLRPAKLYVAADGPRPGTTDAELCQGARDLIQVDWPCQLQTLYRTTNLGCRQAVSEAIDWAFQTEEQLIILEDDCLPNLSFFDYTAQLLDYYQDDLRVMHVGGNFFADYPVGEGSYYFSRIPHVWGWATWRRAWDVYDVTMSDWPANQRLVDNLCSSWYQRQKWLYILNKIYQDRRHAWDYQWLYTLLKHDGLAINPNCNLVSNLGFNAGALHDSDPASPFANLPTQTLAQPLIHPQSIAANQVADLATSRRNFRFNPFKVLLRNLLTNLGLLKL